MQDEFVQPNRSSLSMEEYEAKLQRRGGTLPLERLVESDIPIWSGKLLWRVPEATLLALGYRPTAGAVLADLRPADDLVQYARILRNESNTAGLIADLADLIADAILVADLKEPLRPVDFLQWAVKQSLLNPRGHLPADLLSAVLGPVEPASISDEDEIVSLRAQVKDLEAKLDSVRKGANQKYNNVCKILIYIAKDKFHYDSARQRNEASTQIANLLDGKPGGNFSERTVRSHLQNGAKLLGWRTAGAETEDQPDE